MGFASAHKISFSITIWRLIISDMTLIHIFKQGDSFIFPSPGQEDNESFKLESILDLIQGIWPHSHLFLKIQKFQNATIILHLHRSTCASDKLYTI